MSVISSIVGLAENAIAKNLVVREGDIKAMMRAGFDQKKNILRPGCMHGLLYVRWHYYYRLDDGARRLLDDSALAAFKDDLSLLIWTERSFSPGGKAAVPGHVPPVPGSRRDDRLIGNWLHTEYLWSAGSSLVTYHDRTLSPDGRFVERSRSSFSSTFVDNTGNWAGWSDIYGRTSPDSRGWWATFGGRVVFHWDSNHIADYPYEAGPDYFLLLSPNDDNTLWKRRQALQ